MIKRLICKESYLRANREFIEGNVYLADFNAHYDDFSNDVDFESTVFVYTNKEKELGLYFTTKKDKDNFSTFFSLWNIFETEQQNRKKKLLKINNHK